ncbi:hypothetical protein IKF94_00835 [Candidatus Saccharibacteria bacterium]|nr:hypothetical protein [Candidatus Saccharibacteria bacterium]
MAEKSRAEQTPQQGKPFDIQNKNYKPLMTVKEARKRLKKQTNEQLTDEDLEKYIFKMEQIAFTMAKNPQLFNNATKEKE